MIDAKNPTGSETMNHQPKRIRKIDFKRLWAMVDNWEPYYPTTLENFIAFPVPVLYWNEDGDHKTGFIILDIRQNPPVKGGICRFSVKVQNIRFSPSIKNGVYGASAQNYPMTYSLAKYLQTSHYKNNPPKIYEHFENAWLAIRWNDIPQNPI